MQLTFSFSDFRSYGFVRHVTIEPVAFFIFLVYEMTSYLNMNLYLQKSCRFNATTEPDLRTPCDDDKKGLLFVSQVYMNATSIFATVAFFVTIFATIYSDLAGNKRRRFIILTVSGLILQSIWACFQAYFWNWSSLLGILVDLSLRDFSGGILCPLVFLNILICDTTTNENRNMRIIILTSVRNSCGPIGRLVSGHVMHHFGFLKSYLVCLMVASLGLISALILVRDKPLEKGEDEKEPPKVKIMDVLRAKQLVSTFKAILNTEKPKKQKMAIMILLVLGVLVYFPSVGEESVIYLYFRHRFHWDEVRYGTYSSYRRAIGIFGGLSCMYIMSTVLKLHDGILGVFAGFWDTLAVVGFFFADQVWQIYLIPLLDIFHGVAFSTCFSFASKFFDENKFGQLQSVHWTFGLLIIPSIPLYNAIFQKTINVLPNAFFLLSILLNSAVCFLYGITYVLSKDVK